jgi:hypothetical protein
MPSEILLRTAFETSFKGLQRPLLKAVLLEKKEIIDHSKAFERLLRC